MSNAEQKTLAELLQHPSVSAGDTPGAMLRRARIAAGLAPQDVSSQLRLLPTQVTALEEDRYDALANETFIRGYRRAYAKLLKLSQDDVVARFDQFRQAHPGQVPTPPRHHVRGPRQPFQHRRPSRVVRSAGLVILLAVGAGLWFYHEGSGQEDGMQHDVRQALSTWTGGLVEAPPAPVAPVAPATHEVEAPVPARDALQQSQPEPLVPSPDEPPSQEALDPAMSSSAAIEAPPPAAMLPSPVPVGAGVPAETAAPAVPAGTTDVVNMEFSADCWVEIRDANNQLLVSEIKRAGQALALTGKPPLSVHLGNADGVALRWQGQPVTLTPDAGTRTARLVLGN